MYINEYYQFVYINDKIKLFFITSNLHREELKSRRDKGDQHTECKE